MKKRKCSLLMHAPISLVFTLFLPFFLLLSFLLFSSSQFFSYSSLRLASVPHSWLPPFPFILLDSVGFLHFIPKAPPTVFGFLWASFQDCPLTPWLPSHYLCSERACFTIPYLQTKYLVLFLPPLNCCPHQWIRIRLPHHLPLWHVSSGPSPLLASFGQNATLARLFPKRSLGWNPRIDPLFSPPPNHTLLIP